LEIDVDFRVFQKNAEKPSQQKSSKSNVEASLRALRFAAASILSPKPPLIPLNDVPTRSILSNDPKVLFVDETMSALKDTPASALSFQFTTYGIERKPL
jgi:hypothetical protein